MTDLRIVEFWAARLEMLDEWNDAYRAFKGAFDTPLSRKRQGDEYAEDARKRLAAFDEKMRALAQQPTAVSGGNKENHHANP